MTRELRCEICGSSFTCGMGGVGCWCADVAIAEGALGELRKMAKDCVCQECLENFTVRK